MRLSKSSKNKIAKWVFLAGFVIAGLYLVLFAFPVFKVSELDIKGINELEVSKVYGYISTEILDKGIFSVRKDYLTSVINEKIPQYMLFEYTVIFPNKVSLNLKKRDEKYFVSAPNGVFVIDNTGFVLRKAYAKREDLIDISFDKYLEVGQEVSDRLLKAALTYSELKQKVKIENGQLIINLDSGGKAIVPSETSLKSVDKYLTMLQKILQKYTIENRSIDLIDLRNSRPVIKFK